MIADWWYEDPDSMLELIRPHHQNIKEYHPDFTILYPNGDYEFEETKGYFPAKDYSTLLMAAEQYDTPINLIFAYTSKNPKSSKIRVQIRRAERLETHINRIVWNANKDIFEKIKYLMKE